MDTRRREDRRILFSKSVAICGRNKIGLKKPMNQHLDKIDNDIADKHLLEHPFYLAWTRGELSRGGAG
jgi:hypothetical protein